MIMDAQEYFQAYDKYFWQWEEDGDVLAIPSNGTIAYSSYVEEIVEALCPQGLPPFGSLLMAIIATNPHAAEHIAAVTKIGRDGMGNSASYADIFKQAEDFLGVLASLPPEYKTGTRRTQVFQVVFENCHKITGLEHSKKIVKRFQPEKFSGLLVFENKQAYVNNLYRDFRTVGLLYRKFATAQEVINRVAALPALPGEALEVEETDNDDGKPRDFVDELIAEPKTFHTGALVRRIWSGLNIPVHSVLPSQQPVGGISDLTNKGDLDKLLISEFANDEMVFLSRLANNEALYIQREVPPENNRLQRIILIDASLKNWGTPKNMAFAILLAIAKHPKTDIVCNAFVLGKDYRQVQFDTVHDVINALQILDGSLHMETGLASFFRDFPEDRNREVFLITASATLKQPGMLRAIHTHHKHVHYWIYTDASGNIDVHKRQQSSKRHVQHLLLPLDELWREKKMTQLMQAAPVKPAAAIQTGQLKYPLLLRHDANSKKLFDTPDGELYHVTRERALLRQYIKGKKVYEKGWELMYEWLPMGSEMEVGVNKMQEPVLLIFNTTRKVFILFNIQTKEKITADFKQWRGSQTGRFIFINDAFYFYRHFSINPWQIKLDGTITVVPNFTELKQDYQKRVEHLEVLKNEYRFSYSVYKRIKTIYINQNGNLVIGKHELVNYNEFISLDYSRQMVPFIEARKEGGQCFVFPNGSKISTHTAGVFILETPDNKVPDIYISAVLDDKTGCSTHTEFAGNRFYFKEPLFNINVLAVENKLEIVKAIRAFSEKGLMEAKMLADTVPGQIFSGVDKVTVKKIVPVLKQAGAKFEVLQLHGHENEIHKIDAALFFKKYISAFTKHIIDHGATA